MHIIRTRDIEITVKGKRFMEMTDGELNITPTGGDDMHVLKALDAMVRAGRKTIATVQAQQRNSGLILPPGV